jgi:hypothetical protein
MDRLDGFMFKLLENQRRLRDSYAATRTSNRFVVKLAASHKR